MISRSPLNAALVRSIGKKYWKDTQDKNPGKYYSKVLQHSITAKNYDKEKTEDRIYRGLPFFHSYY